MPAIQNEYDDYGYIAMRRGTAKAAPRVSDSKKRSTAKTNTRPTATKVNTARMAAAKNANRESIRAVMRENTKNSTTSKTTTKRKTTHNLDVPNTARKKKVSKPEEISLKKAEFMRSPKQKAKVNANTLRKENILKNTATFLCVFSVLLLICYRSSVINESFRDLNSIKAALTDANTVNAQIESDIQTQTDISNIESYAKYQLGMQKPKESQIQKIVVEKEDKISTPVVIEEEKDSFWDSLVNDVLNILD
ncbi:MAG: hypothetical protein IJX99_08900 [Clostridia bacterium]|nr:hypothetical protein [Clostridia bacterium]